jgi:hypothetical protein
VKFKTDPEDNAVRMLAVEVEGSAIEVTIPKTRHRKAMRPVLLMKEGNRCVLMGISNDDLKRLAKAILKEFDR